MTTSLGLTSVVTQTINQLTVDVNARILPATVASGATPTIGQVMTYNYSTGVYADTSTVSTGDKLAIFADTLNHSADGTALTADTVCAMLVAGDVSRDQLDDTSAALSNIDEVLHENSIYPRSQGGA